MECDAFGLSARRRHHININVAANETSEREMRAVRGKCRKALVGRMRGQAPGFAAVAIHGPQISGIVENDLRATHRHPADHRRAERLGRLGEYDCGGQRKQGYENDLEHGLGSFVSTASGSERGWRHWAILWELRSLPLAVPIMIDCQYRE